MSGPSNSSTPTTRWLVDVSATGQPGLYNVKDTTIPTTDTPDCATVECTAVERAIGQAARCERMAKGVPAPDEVGNAWDELLRLSVGFAA